MILGVVLFLLFLPYYLFAKNDFFQGKNKDPEAILRGKAKSNLCMACHGPQGVSSNPLWPNLAEQKKEYLIKQLQDFINEDRKNSLMSPVAKTLSPQDLNDLAEYYSSLKTSK